MLRTPRLNRTDVVGHAVTGQAKLRHATGRQESWICGTMRRMTCHAAFVLHRRMLVDEWTLFVGVTLNARGVSACCQSCLLEFKTAVWIVAVRTLHRAFEHLVVEGHIELVFDFRVTTQAKLRLVEFQQLNGRERRFLSVTWSYKNIRAGKISSRLRRVRRMAINTTDVVAPVLAAAEVVVLFFAGVTGKTRLGDVLRRHAFERNDLFRIALFTMSFARPMTRFATGHLILPAANLYELRMRSVREGFELIFVTVFAGIATDIVFCFVCCIPGLARLHRVRRAVGTQPTKGRRYEGTD